MRTLHRREWIHPRRLLPRIPQEGGPNIVFGPGGQAAIVPSSAPPPEAVLSQSDPQTQLETSRTQSQPTVTTAAPSSLTDGTHSSTGTQSYTTVVPSSSSVSVAPSSATSSVTSPSAQVASTVSSAAATTPVSTSATASSDTTASALNVSSTVVGSPASATTSIASSSSGHSPPFYIGIVLGIIVSIAVIAALVAWYLKLRAHARRRQEFVAQHVPWAIKRNGDDRALEEARGDMGLSVSSSAMMLHADESRVDMWEPRGDRDVGEPRRTDSYQQSPVSPTKRTVAGAYHNQSGGQRTLVSGNPGVTNPFLSEALRRSDSLSESVAFPLPTSYPSTRARPLPSHLASAAGISVQEHPSASTLGPLQVANLAPGDLSSGDESSCPGTVKGSTGRALTSEFGTPREAVAGSKPRFWGLDGHGLIVPWAEMQRGAEDSGRRGSGGVGRWEHLAPLPMPGESARDSSEQGTEGWTASLKSNLVNAFNAVAGNFSGPGQEMERDKLTPVPTRSEKRSFRNIGWEGFAEKTLTRESTKSSVWTLEEKENGAGVVHVRGLGLDAYAGLDHAWSPQMSRSTLNVDGEMATLRSYGSQVPLIATRKPPSALIKPLKRLSIFGHSKTTQARTRSIYSTTSSFYGYGNEEECDSLPPRLPMITPLSRVITMRSKKDQDDIPFAGETAASSNSRIPKRPDMTARVSSSGCSTASFASEASSSSEGQDNAFVAGSALRERRLKFGDREK